MNQLTQHFLQKCQRIQETRTYPSYHTARQAIYIVLANKYSPQQVLRHQSRIKQALDRLQAEVDAQL